ncbi:MAG: DUF1569 domain-containing protein [Crocinitomicaceae bacterium]|nr:DUF1569 domain-containing protein [Crocinitomicaceae bacterium]
MALPSIFKKEVTDQLISRINKLTPESQPQWGKMNVAQMFAHCCVSYEMAFESKHPKPGGFVRFMLKLFVKNSVVSEKPYSKSLRTAPAFLITDARVFETEKKRLIDYLNMTFEKGEKYFDGKESLSFGVLSLTEWNNLFYKHMDHHLKQFGV